MKKDKIILRIALGQSLLAILFVAYALNNPQASFAISLEMTKVIYGAYVIVNILLYCLWFIMKICRNS